jgi:hypothetical protein
VVKEIIARCDECGSTEGVQEFQIVYGGKPKGVDLCAEHGGPLIALYELGQDPEPVQAAAPKRGRIRHAVVPIEDTDIEVTK